MAVSLPLPGVRVFSVSGSHRHCVELNEVHTLCVLHPDQPGISAHWRSGRQHDGFDTGAGEVMVMELGEVHRTTRVEGTVCYSVVQLDPKVVQRVAPHVDERTARRVRAASVSDPALGSAMLRFVAAVAREEAPAILEPLLAMLILTWLDLCAEDGLPRERVVHFGIRRARDTLRQNLQLGVLECPPLQQLAEIANLSPPGFSHAFRDWLGLAPHLYFNFTRLYAARRTLEQGMSATDVAARYGYADLPHFSRQFRKQFGLPPRVWTKLARREWPGPGPDDRV